MKAVLKFNRRSHLWLATLILIPIAVVLVTGVMLQVRKEFDWIQPPTQKGTKGVPMLSWSVILDTAKEQDVGIEGWEDISRLDVRPGRGIVKIQAKNHWELQLDLTSGELLQKAYRRSGIIEDIHQGSWFHPNARLWLFLPAALCLLWLWISGAHMLTHTMKK